MAEEALREALKIYPGDKAVQYLLESFKIWC